MDKKIYGNEPIDKSATVTRHCIPYSIQMKSLGYHGENTLYNQRGIGSSFFEDARVEGANHTEGGDVL